LKSKTRGCSAQAEYKQTDAYSRHGNVLVADDGGFRQLQNEESTMSDDIYRQNCRGWKDVSNKKDDINRLKSRGVMNLADFCFRPPARPSRDR
jgi:hypothetical protein